MQPAPTEPKLADPDRAYRLLIEAHRGLSDADSAALNARLILLLANEVADIGVLKAIIATATASMPSKTGPGQAKANSR